MSILVLIQNNKPLLDSITQEILQFIFFYRVKLKFAEDPEDVGED